MTTARLVQQGDNWAVRDEDRDCFIIENESYAVASAVELAVNNPRATVIGEASEIADRYLTDTTKTAYRTPIFITLTIAGRDPAYVKRLIADYVRVLTEQGADADLYAPDSIDMGEPVIIHEGGA